jgi:hypothetical protein
MHSSEDLPLPEAETAGRLPARFGSSLAVLVGLAEARPVAAMAERIVEIFMLILQIFRLAFSIRMVVGWQSIR